MTASELAEYFSDTSLFANPGQEVRFVLSPKDVSIEKGTRLEMRGSTVPERGEAVVAFRPVRRYRFALKFGYSPVVEAESLEEAKEKALDMMCGRKVVNALTGGDDRDYEAQEPRLLGEVEG